MESELHSCGLESGEGNSNLTSYWKIKVFVACFSRGFSFLEKRSPLNISKSVCEQTIVTADSKQGEAIDDPKGSFRPHVFVCFEPSCRISVLCIMRALERMFSVSFPP